MCGDIAMLRLVSPIDNIKPVELPEEGIDFGYQAGYSVFVAGFGRQTENQTDMGQKIVRTENRK